MIKLQIRELCILRGLKTPTADLRKSGISHKVASQYLTGKKKHILLHHIEILCKLLRCAPNDLIAWTPDDKAEDFPENPLQAIRQRALPDLQKVIGKLSLEEVRQKLES